MSKSVGSWGSAPDPDGGAFSAPPYPLAGREGCPPPAPSPGLPLHFLFSQWPHRFIFRCYGPVLTVKCVQAIPNSCMSRTATLCYSLPFQSYWPPSCTYTVEHLTHSNIPLSSVLRHVQNISILSYFMSLRALLLFSFQKERVVSQHSLNTVVYGPVWLYLQC